MYGYLSGYDNLVIQARACGVDTARIDEVVQAVKEGLFHIYPISKIDEGIELLMGLSAGKKNKAGNFPANSVHGRVMKKLKAFDKRAQGEEE